MSIETLFDNLEKGRTTWAGLYDLLINGKYDIAGTRPSLNGQSVEILHRRITLIFEGLLALRPADSDPDQIALITGKENEIRQPLDSFITHAQSSTNSIQPHWRDEMQIRDTNNNFSVQLVQPDGAAIANFDLSGNFAQVDSSLNQLTNHLALLLPLCKTNAVGDLSKRAAELGKLVHEIESLRNQARKFSKDAESSANGAAEKDKAIQGIQAQSEALLAKIQALQQQSTTDSGSVSALVEKIKTVGANAETLEAQITGYQSKFEAFQKQLDDRNAEFSKFQENDTAAREANAKREKEIDRLTKLADTMISGATTAGLAKSLEDTRKRYEDQMNSTRKGFYFSISLLIISALPLAAQLVPGLLGQWIPALDPNAGGSPYAVLGKIILLLPATWLTAFFTKSYAELFRLEREYAHKAALAMSVDGFKRQAPQYQEEITAEVFLEIRNNPAKGEAIEPAAHPLYDVLSRAVGKVLEKKK